MICRYTPEKSAEILKSGKKTGRGMAVRLDPEAVTAGRERQLGIGRQHGLPSPEWRAFKAWYRCLRGLQILDTAA